MISLFGQLNDISAIRSRTSFVPPITEILATLNGRILPIILVPSYHCLVVFKEGLESHFRKFGK